MNGLRIVRLIAGIEDIYLENLMGDSRLIQYHDGTMGVDTELAMDAVIANEVVKHTTGFIITDEQYGKLHGPWRDFKKALDARDGAKIQIVSDVALEPDADEDTEEAAASAGGGALAAT